MRKFFRRLALFMQIGSIVIILRAIYLRQGDIYPKGDVFLLIVYAGLPLLTFGLLFFLSGTSKVLRLLSFAATLGLSCIYIFGNLNALSMGYSTQGEILPTILYASLNLAACFIALLAARTEYDTAHPIICIVYIIGTLAVSLFGVVAVNIGRIGNALLDFLELIGYMPGLICIIIGLALIFAIVRFFTRSRSHSGFSGPLSDDAIRASSAYGEFRNTFKDMYN